VVKGACEAFHQRKFDLYECQINLENIETQTLRPWLTLHLEKVVEEHLKFAYLTHIKRYVSSVFYSVGTEMYGYHEKTKAHLSYQDVKELLKDLTNTSFMSLKQYWEVYNELSHLNDKHFLSTMRDKIYVELLDTLIKNKNEILGEQVEIVQATPGLIKPGERRRENWHPNYDPRSSQLRKQRFVAILAAR
jgi:hypothetical protein